jgi:hypothetical protein
LEKQTELQTVEESLDACARKLQEDLAKIRTEQLRDYDYTHVTLQETFNKTCSAIEATNSEFQAQL